MEQPPLVFSKTYDRTSGEARKQFKSWKIPEDIVLDRMLLDGTPLIGRLRIGRLRFDFVSRTTSGGEFSIGSALAAAIADKPDLRKVGAINFEILVGVSDHGFEQEVTQALRDSDAIRMARLKKAAKKPDQKIVHTIVFLRNPDVVAQKLSEAKGKCQHCNKSAPFKRATTGTPYLEVHHLVRLADGGDDTVENTIALCPNCHRERHYG